MSKNLPLILLVEDSVDDYEATIRSFKKANLNNPIHWCKNGKDALDFLNLEGQYKENLGTPLPALILLDLNMPGIDGRKVLATIKGNNTLKKIPTIILTTSSDESDVNKCYELGASTYIQKPVVFEGLIDAFKRLKDYWFGIAILPKDETHE